MTRKPLDKVMITTDGACLGNPGPGGWAALLQFGAKEKMLSGSEPDTTNNRMELRAVIEGLLALKRKCHVTVVTDSQYVMKAFKEGWLEKWEQNGWKTADRKPVKNKDLWESLVDLEGRHDVHWKWVKGHAGHEENERVDAEARLQAGKA
jgi:ribonuclease HI